MAGGAGGWSGAVGSAGGAAAAVRVIRRKIWPSQPPRLHVPRHVLRPGAAVRVCTPRHFGQTPVTLTLGGMHSSLNYRIAGINNSVIGS